MLNHIYVDQNRINQFDKYFSYVESIKSSVPAILHDFASDVSRYELNGKKTLHDSWIDEITFRRKYISGSNEIASSGLTVRLLLAEGGWISLAYSDVVGHEFQGFSNKWPDMAVDLLVHEFSLESDAIFSHTLVFDRGVYLKIFFRGFSFIEGE